MPETTHDHRFDMTSKGGKNHAENMLDKAVEDSFPASDPVSMSMPHHRIESRMQALRENMRMPSTGTMLIAGGALLAIVAVLAFRK
jgi:beta-lactamase regulating signal transducer with metallopeptidase domain